MADLLIQNYDLRYLAVTLPSGMTQSELVEQGFRQRILHHATPALRCWETRAEGEGGSERCVRFWCGYDGWETVVDVSDASDMYDSSTRL